MDKVWSVHNGIFGHKEGNRMELEIIMSSITCVFSYVGLRGKSPRGGEGDKVVLRVGVIKHNAFRYENLTEKPVHFYN